MTFGQDPGKILEGASTCPHCGGIAKASPSTELRSVCDLCGAPRIEAKGAPGLLSGRELPHLRAARAAQKSRALWRVAGVFGGITTGFGLILFLLMAWLFSFGFLGSAIGLAMLLPFALLVLMGFVRSKNKTGVIAQSLAEAWKSAMRDVLTAGRKGMTAAELSSALGITEHEADALAGELTADPNITSRITEDGRLVYESTAGGGVRIDTGAAPAAPSPLADPLEERFAELERQQAEAENKLKTKR